ncbi:MAG: zf-HC2 domain-containing protein [Candidatus Acidiferrum sp.]
MDHSEAMRLQAAEKYVLGELPQAQRDEYEEHYFECPACAEELKATVAFMESARQVVREEVPEAVDAKEHSPATAGWFGWLRPTVAIPALAVLLLFIGYQNEVTIPRLRRSPDLVERAEVVRYFSLRPAEQRGASPSSETIKIGRHERFSLDVDMPGDSPDGYLCQIQDQSGRARITVPVSAEQAKRYVQVDLAGGTLEAGKYNFVVFRGQAPPASQGKTKPVAQETFTLEVVQ